MLKMSAVSEAKIAANAIVALEREASISMRPRRRAAKRPSAVTHFCRDEAATVQRLENEVFGVTGPCTPARSHAFEHGPFDKSPGARWISAQSMAPGGSPLAGDLDIHHKLIAQPFQPLSHGIDRRRVRGT